MKKIGITGGIASGKSEITYFLKKKGYTVIDADVVAREAAAPGEPAAVMLRETFGESIFLSDGSLNRKALADLIFCDSGALNRVNEIFHSDIRRRIEANIRAYENQGADLIFIAVPLLFESGMDRMMDENWLVTADTGIRVKRAMARDGIAEKDVLARINNQWTDSQKYKLADKIIENDGTLDELWLKVAALIL